VDVGVSSRAPDLVRDAARLLHLSRRQHHRRTACRHGPRALGAEAARRAGNQNRLATQIHTLEHFVGRRRPTELRRISRHRHLR
jgi:hypothetical protein